MCERYVGYMFDFFKSNGLRFIASKSCFSSMRILVDNCPNASTWNHLPFIFHVKIQKHVCLGNPEVFSARSSLSSSSLRHVLWASLRYESSLMASHFVQRVPCNPSALLKEMCETTAAVVLTATFWATNQPECHAERWKRGRSGMNIDNISPIPPQNHMIMKVQECVDETQQLLEQYFLAPPHPTVMHILKNPWNSGPTPMVSIGWAVKGRDTNLDLPFVRHLRSHTCEILGSQTWRWSNCFNMLRLTPVVDSRGQWFGTISSRKHVNRRTSRANRREVANMQRANNLKPWAKNFADLWNDAFRTLLTSG